MVKFAHPAEALAYLEDSLLWIKDKTLRAACETILEDQRFRLSWGSNGDSGKHHAYAGGLLVHTAEVMSYVRQLTSHEELITAVIFHDCAKIFDYDELGEKTDYCKLIRHVAGSFAIFSELLRGSIPNDQFERIGHCILAHHGRKEWGSPVEPQTEHAMLLHQADMWSAHYGPGK
jgi:3'-5' exoribonuclease